MSCSFLALKQRLCGGEFSSLTVSLTFRFSPVNGVEMEKLICWVAFIKKAEKKRLRTQDPSWNRTEHSTGYTVFIVPYRSSC